MHASRHLQVATKYVQVKHLVKQVPVVDAKVENNSGLSDETKKGIPTGKRAYTIYPDPCIPQASRETVSP